MQKFNVNNYDSLLDEIKNLILQIKEKIHNIKKNQRQKSGIKRLFCKKWR